MHDDHNTLNADPAEVEAARLTAYALGELDPAEQEALERQLIADPRVAAEVEHIRRTAEAVAHGLRAEPAAGLTTAQRDEIEFRLSRRAIRPAVWHRRSTWVGLAGAAVAAGLALAVGLPILFDTAPRDDRSTHVFGEGAGDPAAIGGPKSGTLATLNDVQESNLRADGEREVLAIPGDGRGNAAAPLGESSPGGVESARRLANEPVPPGGGASGQMTEARDEGTRARHLVTESLERGGSSAPRGMEAPPALPSPTSPADTRGPAGSGGRGFPGGVSGGLPGGGGGGGAVGAPAARPAAPDADGFSGGAPMRQGAPRDADSEVGQESFGRDRFIREAPSNPFKSTVGQEDSTFSIDVDTASYANLRRMLLAGQWPRPDQVHIEEMLNYFSYSDPAPAPDAEHPVAAHVELATCPWAPDHRLARITLKAREIDMANRVGSNLVFLIDVSGSMAPADRLPLIKESLTLLVNTLTEDDRIAIVTYAGDTRVALPPTYANRKPEILDVIDSLRTGGGTNGASGLQLAYDTAAAGFIEGGINRVILATDGDFNVGVSSAEGLRTLVEEKRQSGVFLSVLGVGRIGDDRMKQLAMHGNGNYAFLDSVDEARRVLVKEIGGTLVTVAGDVKVQVEFNPALVSEYRLIGYERRVLAAEDFADDSKDAGEIGAGHAVTALYEIVPVRPGGGEDAVTEQTDRDAAEAARRAREAAETFGGDMLRVRVRYKRPDGAESTEFAVTASDTRQSFESASRDFQFASAVAVFGLVLRESPFRGAATLQLARELAAPAAEHDATGYRQEFLRLVDRAVELRSARAAPAEDR